MKLLGAALMFGTLISSAAAQEVPIVGKWLTGAHSEIIIAPCAQGYCGVVSKAVTTGLSAEDIAAHPAEGGVADFRNKDPNLRTRPILGLQILTLGESTRPGVYDGEIYNPEDGNTYSGFMEVLGPDSIRLKGCVLFNTLCRGETWTRIGR